jgi:hypothetical protein
MTEMLMDTEGLEPFDTEDEGITLLRNLDIA